MAVSPQATGSGAYNASGPTVSASWTPIEDDLVVAWVSTSNNAALSGVPSGWADVGAGVVTPGDTTCYLICVIHTVTAAEETAGTTSWDLSGLWAAAEQGEWMLRVYRGAAGIDAYSSWTQAATGATHTLPGLTGGSLATGSVVASGIIADAPGVSYTTPSGWTGLVTGAGTNTGRWLGELDTLTTSGTDVSDTSITASIGDEGNAITVAVEAAATGGVTGTFTATTPAATAGVPSTAWSGTAAVPQYAATLAAPSPAVTIATPAVAWSGAATAPVVTGTWTADAPTVIVAVPGCAWSGTATAPQRTGTLAATTPAATIAPPTVAWSGTTSGLPEVTGTLTANTPGVTAAAPAATWTGVVLAPMAGTLSATTPGTTVSVPTVAWSGTVSGPGAATGTLAATLPAVTIAVPVAAWTGTQTAPPAIGAALVATLPAVTIGPPLATWGTVALGAIPSVLRLTITAPRHALTIDGHPHQLAITTPNRRLTIT